MDGLIFDPLICVATTGIAIATSIATLAHARCALGFFLLWLPLTVFYVLCTIPIYYQVPACVFYFQPIVSLGIAILGLVATVIYGVAGDGGRSPWRQ